MSRRDDLIALRDAVQAGEYPTQAEWSEAFPDTPNDDDYSRSMMAVQANVGWVDAALDFLADVAPEWTVNGLTQLRHPDNGMKPTGKWECLLFAALESRFAHASAKADDPARALLIATFNAKIGEME